MSDRTPRTEAGKALIRRTFGMKSRSQAAFEELRDAILAIEAESAAEPVPLTLDALTVEKVVGWARFSSADIRGALKNLRGPVDRDESLVMAAADLFASMMEQVAALASPDKGEPR